MGGVLFSHTPLGRFSVGGHNPAVRLHTAQLCLAVSCLITQLVTWLTIHMTIPTVIYMTLYMYTE